MYLYRTKEVLEHLNLIFNLIQFFSLDFNEFLIALSVNSPGDVRKKLEWAFSIYDIDGNGHIDRKEMRKIIKV